jgi:hypothetical protein
MLTQLDCLASVTHRHDLCHNRNRGQRRRFAVWPRRRIRARPWLRPRFGQHDSPNCTVRPLDIDQHNAYVVFVLPEFTAAGLLPPGVHRASWAELCLRFGWNSRREWLLAGLLRLATNLRDAGATTVWLDGSFVTTKPEPGDFDGTWDPSTADLRRVDPILLDPQDLGTGRMRQKLKYGGELIPGREGATGKSFVEFFQETRDGQPKGIVLLDLGTLP